MKPKPNPKQIKRATAQVRADHRPRQLQHEPRPSVADERNISDLVRVGERRAAQAEVQKRIASIRQELELLNAKLGIAAPGDHRDPVRMITRALNTLERSLSK